MRRSVWLLAMCGFAGLSLHEARAQEAFGPANPFESAKPTRSMFFSAREGTETEASGPSRFVRSTGETAAQPERKNFYSELFGSEEQPAVTGAVAPAVETETAETGEVMQAAFEQGPAQGEAGEIQQVRDERPNLGSARPFPRQQPEARPVPVAGGGSRLSQPIATEQAEETKPVAPNPPADGESKGSFTISRGAPARPTATAPAVVAQAGPQTPSVSVEWVKKSDINVGQECACELVVKNPGSTLAANLEVEAFFPNNIRLVSAEPQPIAGTSSLTWRFEQLAPGETQVLAVKFVPLERGAIATRADVRFSASAAGTFNVAEPLLAIKIDGPSEVLIGEPASHTVHVSNPGTGIASNVQVEALIPDGLEHARGKRLVMDLGSLNPGETRPVRLALAATAGGPQVIQVQVRGEGGLVQTSSSEVAVVAPHVVAGIDGPGLRYVGRPGTYTLKVLNDGAAPTDNVRVMHKIPEGMSFVSADRGTQYDPSSRLLSWFVGRLTVGQSAEVKVTLNSDKIGEFTHFVRATAEHGVPSDAQFTTAVEGTSSLAIEVRDLDDPVEVGSEAIY